MKREKEKTSKRRRIKRAFLSCLFYLGEHFRPFVLNATAGTNLTLWAADQV